ncbi:hypothetical protein FA95DRAFT_1332674 [Auriscalpium vulgare]|uniref:Uncharacterized protein n=1 Tax=Auriscalpium vulgare TaxID=40419 RepID=A0ACB8S8M4_9AGAM|nr:hypothetical protein FA95DRAFT_1332674 [Auriscalpium vulgare]
MSRYNPDPHACARPNRHRRTTSESHRGASHLQSRAPQTPPRFRRSELPPPNVLSPEWDEVVRQHDDRLQHAQAWAEADQLLKYRKRAEERRSRSGIVDTPTSPLYSPISPSASSSAYSSGMSSPIDHGYATLYSQQARCRLTRDLDALAEAQAAQELRHAFPVTRTSSYSNEYEQRDDAKTAGHRRLRPSSLMRALTKNSSPRHTDPTDSSNAPAKRLAPLSRFNPFVRARSESLSSVIEDKNEHALAGGAVASPTRRFTVSSAVQGRGAR